MASGGDPHIVLDDPALKLDGHLSVLATRAAAEHPTASTGHACGAYVSVQECLSKARTASPVGPLARRPTGKADLAFEGRSRTLTYAPRACPVDAVGCSAAALVAKTER